MASARTSLKDELAAALSHNFQCKVRYLHSPSRPCDPLFSPPSGSEPEKTRLASHFLSASIIPKTSSGDSKSQDVLVLGIEVLIYSTKHLTTLFVSKADSTGYLPQQRPSPAKGIITTFLRSLSSKEREKHPSRKVVISLFARSQSQYLFPGSAENSNKHVLDDRQLIKWWARVLDPIFPMDDEHRESQGHDSEYEGYITVPGYECAELRQYMPPNSGGRPRWKAGNPLAELAEARRVPSDAPPRCLLPRFPDDPKARFMQDLDDEVGMAGESVTVSPAKKRKSGKWSSIRNLDRFWEAMEFRQECSSGRVVGFLWLVMRPQQSLTDEDAANGASQDSVFESQNSDIFSQQDETESASRSPIKRRRKPLSGPIVPRQPRLKGGSSSLTASSDLVGMLDPPTTEGVVLGKEGYAKAMHTLLQLDFSSLETASASTTKWTSDVTAIAGFQTDWSLEIKGTAKSEGAGVTNGSNGTSQVNDLGGMIRKKRKAEDLPVTQPEPAMNVSGTSMIRKKPKSASS
ncbi:hypothetical protein LTR09_007838 [Extremus antarcticus]|uniref:histone acetyltransferase n=1 Tax=Extremus antarcticus TaxID=702011 RepID=A0AAJ0G6R5_9PEZI|nr:hypothetical protein LTR09_007838 [Extremus antarcticus]